MKQAALFDGSPLESGERFRVELADAVDWLRALPAESIDLVVTDPAYESLEKHRAKGTTTRLKVSDGSSNAWFPIFPNGRFLSLLAECYRVLKKNTHCYVMCDQETMFLVKPIAESVGFKWWKGIVWDKVAIGMGYHYRAKHEMVCFLEKGHRNLNDKSIPDVLTVKRVHGGYPTEKPVGLSEILVKQSSEQGEIVIDPFLGSGSVGAAALLHGRRFLGCDVNPEAITVATSRLKGL